MNFDPFDSWYERQVDVDGEQRYKAGAWQFFTLSYDADQTTGTDEQVIASDDIDAWIDGLASRVPGVDLLLMRHRHLGTRDVMHRWLPLPSDRFKTIIRNLKIPPQYLHLRSSGGAGCGAYDYSTLRDSEGKVTHINFVLRPGHGSEYRSFWAFAGTWDAKTGRTVAIMDGMTAKDLDKLKNHLKSAGPLLHHPLMFQEILLHMIITYLHQIRIPEDEAYFSLERKTGISRVNNAQDAQTTKIWDWTFEQFQDATRVANRFNTTVAYFARRFSFALQVAKRLLDIMDMLKNEYQFEDHQMKAMIQQTDWFRREQLHNRIALLEGYEHINQCMGKRNENLVAVLYTVLNLQIAQAVRNDSIPMRTIAYVTLIFLPGAYVAAIFGMNFFQFAPESQTLVLGTDFWLYWAITAPVTLLTLLVWNWWVYWEKRKTYGVSGGKVGEMSMGLGEMRSAVERLGRVREKIRGERKGDGEGV
ncbi:hypothetical protein EJ04DRAFT_578618 [Polyplosphaeria fusca]|uniref:Uncharacterized protein n=1 Tax=Polyplosphaeria fusca TaxID=682080 RepID=A0A9P4V0E9_9PLEO|nr:hypothetical protein EJ04DRAFT_578618 [Polyplosphaeria fusca]